MAYIAEFSVSTDSFALAETLPAFPDVAVEADRIVGHTQGTTMPCIWAADGDADGFAETVVSDRTVVEVLATAAFDGQRLYHLEWSDEIIQLVENMIDHEGVLLEASGRGDRWRLRIRFMTRDQFTDFQTEFTDNEPSFRLEQLFTPKYPGHTRGDVTPDQAEALRTASELGYFRVPRGVSIQDVAEALDISDQAVSERIRRGTENLVRDMLTVEPIQDR